MSHISNRNFQTQIRLQANLAINKNKKTGIAIHSEGSKREAHDKFNRRNGAAWSAINKLRLRSETSV